jgi:hypothetical protein
MFANGQAAAGVTVPDTKLAGAATELVREAASDLVYHHSRRVFWFGSLQGRAFTDGMAPRPATTFGTVNADVLDRFVPGFQRASFVDIIENSDWPE